VADEHPEVVAMLAPILEASNEHYVTGHIPEAQLQKEYEQVGLWDLCTQSCLLVFKTQAALELLNICLIHQVDTTTAWGSFVGPCWIRKKKSVQQTQPAHSHLKTDSRSSSSSSSDTDTAVAGQQERLGAAFCNLSGNWTGPASARKGLQIKIVHQNLSDHFMFFAHDGKGWVVATIVGHNVTIPGYRGTVGKSPYPDLQTGSPASTCSLMAFVPDTGHPTPAAWCKYPDCPFPMPTPQPIPPPGPPAPQVPLILFPQNAGSESAANLDGSPYGVYFRPSPSGKSTKWTVSIVSTETHY
jgi:hypothetical protein